MAYIRGRFGVEYHPRGTSETHHLRWLVVVVALLVLVSFVVYRFTNRNRAEGGKSINNSAGNSAHHSQEIAISPGAERRSPRNDDYVNLKTGNPKPTVTKQNPGNKEPETGHHEPKTNPEAERVEKWLETAQTRPEKERVLLERLAEAERRQNVPVAIDAIKKLYDRPTMADLQDRLVRRLGDLNLQHLFSGATTPWTAVVTVRRGDSRDRIAREYRTTSAAVAKLNPNVKWEKLRPGDSVRVLNFPSAVLVIYKQRGYADLSLKNGHLFRRYYLTISKTAVCAVYPVSSESGATVYGRFRELGVKVSPSDRQELEMFLAPGSRITVAE